MRSGIGRQLHVRALAAHHMQVCQNVLLLHTSDGTTRTCGEKRPNEHWPSHGMARQCPECNIVPSLSDLRGRNLLAPTGA